MEAYPPQYVEHNLPLVLLSGLGQHGDNDQTTAQTRRQESGAKIVIESPECQDEKAAPLLQEFTKLDGRIHAWNSDSLPGPTGSIRYRVETVGRSYTLPARKAAPLPLSPGAEGSPPPRNTELHSPLSPLSPGSGVFPDGLFTPLWFAKHQQQVPALFIAFFDLDTEDGASPDEQIKTDVNGLRAALARSGFKTRFATVLLSSRSILHVPELEDRLASIRRATSLDPKFGLFFMPPMKGQAEIATFVQSIVTALQPSCIDYYRDLTKHARRKKARGGPPPQISTIAGSTHTTSASGWIVRYEVKQGAFAEFRQEMDVAERHYSAAMEELFSSEGGVFETTASWNPRWDEARLLCDTLAIRVLRCQLWHGQTTGAAQSWQNFKLRMKDLVDRRGKGSNTYGWDAWEARWAGVMSELIAKADVPTLQRSVKDASGVLSAQQIYAMPERAIERLLPFHFLHHPGYWLRLLSSGIRSRWQRALAIPEEDRVPPGQSPASLVASRSKNYDVYLVPEPHEEALYDHAGDLGVACIRATEEFEARRQARIAEQTRLELAEDLVRIEKYADALSVLVQIWEQTAWREDEWRVPFGRLLRLLSECAVQDRTKQTADIMLALTWEMITVDALTLSDKPDLSKCLDLWDLEEPLELQLHDEQRLSPVRPHFAFKARESNVGEMMECQVTLSYDVFEGASIIEASALDFKIGPRAVQIVSELADTDTDVSEIVSTLEDPEELEDGTVRFRTTLQLRSAQRRILNFSIVPREALEHAVHDMSLSIITPKFRLMHVFQDAAIRPSNYWYRQENGQLEGTLLQHIEPRSISVLPKPPKMQIRLAGLRKDYFTDEPIQLDVELVNEEAESVDAKLVPKIAGPDGEVLDFRWLDSDAGVERRSIEDMKASATETVKLYVQAPPDAGTYVLSLDLAYSLSSDVDTPLSKTISVEMIFVHAFEAKFTFSPQLHSADWPSYFDARLADGNEADGIVQSWKVDCQLQSLVSTALQITKLQLVEHESEGDAACVIQGGAMTETRTLLPGGKDMSTFELTTQKQSLDDRRPSHLDLSLVVTWSNQAEESTSQEEATTTISVPRLTVPTSEPRVLCTRASSVVDDSVTVRYHLENPSAHFLTFALNMEASEEFAFSGPKYRSLSLAPLSRHCVSYQLTATGESVGWLHPNLQVMDSYYQKNLKVHPGGKGVKLDERRELSVWVGEGQAPE